MPPTQVELLTYRPDILHIVQDVFSTMLGSGVSTLPGTWTPAPPEMTAMVYFTGEWKGAALIECNREQAFAVTSRLMSIPLPRQMNNDVLDSMGELANMIGGNMKAILPKGLDLSMPSVVEGSDYVMRICGNNRFDHFAFESDLGPFRVTLVEVGATRARA
jgi:chemotaxis protein CheX